jgi:hypothetical protein
MSERPQWAKQLLWNLDDVVDETSWCSADDEVYDRVETAVKDILCAEYGHDIVDDQCGIPEHRFCAWCGRSEIKINEET